MTESLSAHQRYLNMLVDYNSLNEKTKNTMKIADLINKNFLFTDLSIGNSKTFFIILIAFVVLIIAGILTKMAKKMHKPLKSRFFNFFLTIGITGVVLMFFRFESIAYIGSRFILILWGLVAIIWYLDIFVYSLFKMPKELKRVKSDEIYKKYLPKKKKEK